MNKILLFKIGALGDVLLTTPLVRALRGRFPEARIDYMTGVWSASALKNNPHLDKVISFPDAIVQKRNILKLLRLAADIRRQKYDVIFVLDPGWQVHLLATFFGSMQVKIRHNNKRIHDSQHYLNLGRQLGCRTNDTTLELTRTRDDEVIAEKLLKNLPHPRLAICPGGAKNPYQELPEKRWPPQHYAHLIRQLQTSGASPVILANQNLTLAQTAAVMARCNAVITHDQGLLHVAATTGTPILALFGPTDPLRLSPLGKQHRVIWKANFPCYHDGKLAGCTPAHDMHNISVAEVITSLTEIART